MCGIAAIIGNKNAYKYLMFALKMLQNRGYDSAGICCIKNDHFLLHKYASTEEKTAVQILDELSESFNGSTIGIVHSRWATTGPVNDVCSHPHVDNKNRFALVHNGIIENYMELKKELIKNHGINFISQTDTEVIVQLISVYYDESGSVMDAIKLTVNRLEGTWGLVIMCKDRPNKLYCARHGSPLLIGFSTENDYMMVASEQSGFCKYVNNYICLNNHDIVVLKKKGNIVSLENNEIYEKRNITIDIDHMKLTPEPYPHWTIKEINEQYDAAIRAMGMGGRILSESNVRLGGLESHYDHLKYIDHLIILGCGTSYYAGLYALKTFKEISGFDTVQIFDGSEFNDYDIPKSGKTALLFLSQSGETKDLHRCIELGKDRGIFMLGVVNVVDSMIAREVNCGVYLNAGREVAVASTKAFTSQTIVLTLIAIWFAQIRRINEIKRVKIIEGLRRLPLDIKSTINQVINKCKDVAKYLNDQNSVFILGKGSGESIAKEGSLKIKEIGYIHAEGYSSSSLKHGPYSLIEKGTPVVIISPNNKFLSKNNIVIDEIKARGAFVIGISDVKLSNNCDIQIKIPNNDIFNNILSVIPLQLIAYELACYKGHNCDYPRNLSKTISTY